MPFNLTSCTSVNSWSLVFCMTWKTSVISIKDQCSLVFNCHEYFELRFAAIYNPPIIANTVPPWAATRARIINCWRAWFPFWKLAIPSTSAAVVKPKPRETKTVSYSEAAVRRCFTKQSLFNRAGNLKASNFIKNRLQHRCFPENIAKFLRPAFL